MDTAKTELRAAYTQLYVAQGKVNSGIEGAQELLSTARQNLSSKIAAWEDAAENLVKWKLSQPGKDRLSSSEFIPSGKV